MRGRNWLWEGLRMLWVVAAVGTLGMKEQGESKAEEDRPGGWVEVVRPTELKVENRVVSKVIPGTLLKVQQVQGTWLWVQMGGKLGWVPAELVRRPQVRRPGILEFAVGIFLAYDENSRIYPLSFSYLSNPFFAYVAGGPNGQRMVINGRFGPLYKEIEQGVLSVDGQHCAYVAKKGEKWLVVLDGQEGPEYDKIGKFGFFELIFSEDGERFAYAAQKGEKWVIVLDGRESPEYDEIGNYVFSADSRHFASEVEQGGRGWIVLDGRDGPKYDTIAFGKLRLSADGRRTVYVVKKGKKERIVVDGQEGQEYDDIDEVKLTPDGQRIAYVVGGMSGKKW